MANLEADSPLCRRIVPSFLDFLNSVEASSVSDKDSLQVAIDCLSEAFKIDSSSTHNVPKSDSLLQIFSSKPDQNAVIKEEKGVSDVSSTVNDSVVNSKNPEASQTLNAGIKEKGVDKDPEVVKSSKKKKKKKNKSARRKNRSEELLKNTDDSGGSSSQNSENYPHFNLDDYPFARDEDRNIMKIMNEYNRRNHAIIKLCDVGGSTQSVGALDAID
ncbi:uncharacterized protein [Rutidosis leptorrhynchoides]|uniref:uncharacterized protein n=1 Tax=Rutidosis leptorrhynchoides TaxID=125765 RepID=UPI003A9A25A3